MIDYEYLKQRLEELISDSETSLTKDEAKEVRYFIDVNEFGVAYETLIDIISEEEKTISERVFHALAKLGNEMELGQDAWSKLRSYVKDA